ncbi:phosphatase PAP2 family protein [Novosphingobium sp. MW5]|nr:phosphatase PAP2 family protein [Novosphingobium sp. MW5]
MKPYLAKEDVPDSLKIDPPPPAKGSGEEARDLAAQKAALKLQNTPRFALAARDADLTSPQATSAFSCAAGIAIGPVTTPKIDALLRRTMGSFGLASAPTKQKYMRKRPFVVNGKPTCTPSQENLLRTNGSYTSGHSGIGWGQALVLAEIFPNRAAELVARGRAFGDSRRICNVHWLSDVEQGQVVASAVFARLQSEPAYLADLAAAREEAKALAGTHVPAGCDVEAAALAQK